MRNILYETIAVCANKLADALGGGVLILGLDLMLLLIWVELSVGRS